MSRTQSNATISDEEKVTRQLLWEKVNDPNFVQEAKPMRKIQNASNKTTVPIIPEDLLSGSSNSLTENKVFKSMLGNPLVPLGMLATCGCLIGMCKASLDRNMMRTQYYMRGRIAAQFFTVCVLVGGAAYYGMDPRGYSNKPGSIPTEQDMLTKAILKSTT